MMVEVEFLCRETRECNNGMEDGIPWPPFKKEMQYCDFFIWLGVGQSYYTLVVEWGWGRVLLWPVEGKVLKAWRGCMLVMVLGIMVMVLGVINGTSSGARRSANV